jgi:hypothetical protein
MTLLFGVARQLRAIPLQPGKAVQIDSINTRVESAYDFSA